MSLVEVKDLSKSFGSLSVLKNVNLTVESGQRIAIIGSSGCGKSLFLRLLTRLEEPDQGKILIDGREISGKGEDVNKIRQTMGMVFQDFRLFSEMDVMDNLCLAPVRLKGMSRHNAENKARAILKKVGLSGREHSWPENLSGGQQQRIAICRCLMMDPKLLLFDEPTSALDPSMVGEVQAIIRSLASQSMTMLIVTHDMDFARDMATRVLFFADGAIYEEGSPEDIFDHPKREKTKAFIRRIRQFHYEVSDRQFDLMQMMGGIQSFGVKYGLDRSRIYRLQLCCEEMIYDIISHCYSDTDPVRISLEIVFSEAHRIADIFIQWNGEDKDQDPLAGRADELGLVIVRKIASDIHFHRDHAGNHIHMTLV